MLYGLTRVLGFDVELRHVEVGYGQLWNELECGLIPFQGAGRVITNLIEMGQENIEPSIPWRQDGQPFIVLSGAAQTLVSLYRTSTGLCFGPVPGGQTRQFLVGR